MHLPYHIDLFRDQFNMLTPRIKRGEPYLVERYREDYT